MFCTNCGAQLPEGSTFCTSCGNKLEANTQAGETTVLSDINNQAPANNYQAPANNYQAPAYVPPAQPFQAAPVGDVTPKSHFDGGLLGLIGVNLVVFFVSAITLGFAWPALWCFRLRWVYSHTVIGGNRLKFNGKGGQLFGKYLLWILLTIVTFSIYSWWIPIKYKKWEISHVVIDSKVI